MNPSSSGWIKKILKILDQNQSLKSIEVDELYFELRNCGFIYGNNVFVISRLIETNDLTSEEICKINLLIALFVEYKNASSSISFIDSLINFYTEVNEYKTSFIQDILGEKKSTTLVENILHKRILIDDNIITKNFSYFITNALLYIDILAYKQYLKTNDTNENYIKQFEATLQTIVLSVLNSKLSKTEYDLSLIKLFESSLRYQDNESITFKHAIKHIKNKLEANYILDLACMSTWSDLIIDPNEQDFLIQLRKDLKLNENAFDDSIEAINLFYKTHKDDIVLLGSKNIVKTFYNNSSQMVSKLISRNSKRLQKELKQSKELMVLLSKSTVRDLNKAEQKKVQEQLLDIFKSIPSLAIFLLPGGALLLPLVIKFIPKLLPSAFDDNRIEE